MGWWRAPRLDWGVAAVAVAAVAVTFILVPHTRTTDRAPAGALVWLPGPEAKVTLRDEGDATGDSVFAGLDAYARRDLPTAHRLLAQGNASGSIDQMRRLYLADVLLREGRARDAIETLDPVLLDRVPEPWRSEGLWVRAQSWRVIGREAPADSLIRWLATRSGAVGDRARAALRAR